MEKLTVINNYFSKLAPHIPIIDDGFEISNQLDNFIMSLPTIQDSIFFILS